MFATTEQELLNLDRMDDKKKRMKAQKKLLEKIEPALADAHDFIEFTSLPGWRKILAMIEAKIKVCNSIIKGVDPVKKTGELAKAIGELKGLEWLLEKINQPINEAPLNSRVYDELIKVIKGESP